MILYSQHPTTWLKPSSEEHQDSGCLTTQYQYQALFLFHPTLESSVINPPPSVHLPSRLMTQALIRDCQEMKDGTRYVGASVVTLIRMICAQARHLRPENRTDWSVQGSQVGKRKVHHREPSFGML